MNRQDIKTIPFSGTVAAGAEKTLCSPLITTPFRLLSIKTNFPLNTNRTVQQKFYIADDDSTPATGEPSGVSVLAEYGQVDYIVGDDQEKTIEHNATQDTGNGYVKIYSNNTDAFDHTIDATITIQLLDRR